MFRIIIKNKNHLPEAAAQFIKHTGERRIFAFYGAMGAGKTTIIKSICQALGSTDSVTSPTFTIVNEYKTRGEELIYHIDFYRIKKLSEVFDFGIEEYLSGGSWCFIEWPEMAENILPAETVKIRITVDEREQRIMEII
jgi:tRNA threonylcarbamoyladenosine biosynthesis protein TsaE